MKIIGLTGGVASGKNFVAEIFKKNGAEIFDADAKVHKILSEDKKIISQISENFPSAVKQGVVDRKALGRIVFSDEKKLKILENILHQEVRKKHADFIKKVAADKKNKKQIVVLNIPLLLECNHYKCDKIVSVVVYPSVQKRRFLARSRKADSVNFAKEKSNLEKKFQQIFAKQIDNAKRKEMADFVINSSFSKGETIRQAKLILRKIEREI